MPERKSDLQAWLLPIPIWAQEALPPLVERLCTEDRKYGLAKASADDSELVAFCIYHKLPLLTNRAWLNLYSEHGLQYRPFPI